MAQVSILPLLHGGEFRLQKLSVGVVGGGNRVRQKADEGPRLRHPFGRVVELRGVVERHVPDHAPHVPPRQGVVADVGHPQGSESPLTEGEDAFPDRVGHPAVEAVGDDVVELILAWVVREQIDLFQAYIGQAGLSNRFSTGLDLPKGQIETEKRALRIGLGEREEVGAVGATEFQDATAGGAGGVESEQPGHGGQPERVRLRKGRARVGDLVVGVDRHGGR